MRTGNVLKKCKVGKLYTLKICSMTKYAFMDKKISAIQDQILDIQ